MSEMQACRQGHDFLGRNHDRNARRTWMVVALTTVMMVLEIAAGIAFGSMALLADGFHMATHAGAMLIAALAYALARARQNDPRFAFGAGKFGDLAAFTSAVVLAATAAVIAYESIVRLFNPTEIRFAEAIGVAVLGLAVNILSAWLLRNDHDHHHGHEHHHDEDEQEHDHQHAHDHGHDNHHHDLNLKAAYIHVLSDAAVSILAIVGLLAGWRLGWTWMDPVMGLAGAAVISVWAYGLLKAAGAVLLDMAPAGPLAGRMRERLETGGDAVCDLHIWRVGPNCHAAVLTMITADPKPSRVYREKLADLSSLRHVTIEVEGR